MTQKVFADLDPLAAELRSQSAEQGWRLVSIDGADGSGKTCFAERLAKILEWPHLEVDEFLLKRRGGYVEHLRYQDLSRGLERLFGASPVLLDGVCIQRVLEWLRIPADTRIYVQRLIAGSYWPDGDLFSEGTSPEDVIARREKQIRGLDLAIGDPLPSDGQALPGLKKEIIRYHHEYRPHESAEYIYQWSK